MDSLRKIDSLLQGHPNTSIPGIENSSGPLGHGLSQAVGIALALQMDNKPNTVVCCMSDGEHQEGQTWEAIMSAHTFQLKNLIAIIDYNGLQIEGSTNDIMSLGDLGQKYRDFGWNVQEIDGHNIAQILSALEWAKNCDMPAAILARTVLGKGVSFMEGNWKYHDWAGKIDDIEKARQELSA